VFLVLTPKKQKRVQNKPAIFSSSTQFSGNARVEALGSRWQKPETEKGTFCFPPELFYL
jgi:hypothetical protein